MESQICHIAIINILFTSSRNPSCFPGFFPPGPLNVLSPSDYDSGGLLQSFHPGCFLCQLPIPNLLVSWILFFLGLRPTLAGAYHL